MERLIIQDSEGRRAGAVDLQAVVGASIRPITGRPGYVEVLIITDLPMGPVGDRIDSNRDVALARVDHILAAIDKGYDINAAGDFVAEAQALIAEVRSLTAEQP